MSEKVRISGHEVEFTCVCSFAQKSPRVNRPALNIQLDIRVNGQPIDWYEFKDSGYLAEKVSDYIKNTINGQRTFYWRVDEKQHTTKGE